MLLNTVILTEYEIFSSKVSIPSGFDTNLMMYRFKVQESSVGG